ncbi:hypothetical protein LOCC1_G008731 [Lachnellula occidentalis]|uniref:DUF4185 domain-containing protein n=1 Tax=Lachnellula occidentalis TaxID=215460 RepID=A0A8H8U775_9HELO|nr:hypothetical protein LOCC1_G008731 [Lachnellula occidentalis]
MPVFTQYTFVLAALLQGAVASPFKAVKATASTGAVPPVAASVGSISNATLTQDWGITRDGGGGGTIDGTHIINFSDTGAKGGYFVSNSIATTDTDGTTLTDYGTEYPLQQWPLETDEKAPTGHRTAIWPNTNIVSGCNGTCGYTVANVIDMSMTLPYDAQNLYSTLAKITLASNKTPSVERIAPQFWKTDQINFGIYGLANTRDGSGDIYMFAVTSSKGGMKVAKVAEASIADTTKYTYWDGSTWATTAPSASDTTSEIFSNGDSGISTGDVFWSAYYGCWLAVFNDSMQPDNTFRVMYSTTEELTGAWSTTSTTLFTTGGCKGCATPYNYATHAYPDVDSTGKTLLLGWTFDGAYTQFATVTWA